MELVIREFKESDVPRMLAVWNEVVEEGNAFPQEVPFIELEAAAFFEEQSYSAVAEEINNRRILGLYILHPNNIGRCGHICNASYAVSSESRGLHIGEGLVRDCIARARELGYRILQFNAVVASNFQARHLYEKIGFKQLGIIPGGFRMKSGEYEDICPYYLEL